MTRRIPTDFNGLFGEVVCISHHDVTADEDGRDVVLEEGMGAVAFQEDELLDGTPAYLVARGIVEPSRPGVCGRGSRWCLRIDARGVRHVRRLEEA